MKHTLIALLALGLCLVGCGKKELTLKQRAEQGDAEAQFNLGLMYGSGRGVEKDEKEGVKWIRKAAEQGFEPAKAFFKKLSEQQKPKK
jgi:hypothetical protein